MQTEDKKHRYSLVHWVKRYPGRAAGWGYTVAAAFMMATGFKAYLESRHGAGLSLIFTSTADISGSLALALYSDPEHPESQRAKHIDIQDMPLWTRLTSPQKAPNEFASSLGVFSCAGLASLAYNDPSLINILFFTFGASGFVAMSAAERPALSVPNIASATSAFERAKLRVKRPVVLMRNWVRERPLRAAFYLFAPANGCMVGKAILDPAQWLLAPCGLVYFITSALRARSQKRTRFIPDRLSGIATRPTAAPEQ